MLGHGKYMSLLDTGSSMSCVSEAAREVSVNKWDRLKLVLLGEGLTLRDWDALTGNCTVSEHYGQTIWHKHTESERQSSCTCVRAWSDDRSSCKCLYSIDRLMDPLIKHFDLLPKLPIHHSCDLTLIRGQLLVLSDTTMLFSSPFCPPCNVYQRHNHADSQS